MVIKTIRDVDEKTWHQFKQLSVKNRLSMGKLLQKMIGEYEMKTEAFWDNILNHKKILSDKDAHDIEKSVKELRK